MAATDAANAGVQLDGPSIAGGLGTAAGTGGGNVFYQTNVMQPGTDVKQFSQRVLSRGYDEFLAGGTALPVRRNPVQAGLDDQWVGL
jgi:hypothetical protein